MDYPPGRRDLPDSMPDGTEVRSDPGVSTKSKTSKREMASSESTQRGRRDAGVMAIHDAAAHTLSSHRQEEETNSPLRLALARRAVKKQIFTFMDQGDKKTDIETRTGLSHQCIKWHRRLWRNECSHPRPRSKKISKSPSRRAQTPSARSERSSRKRPACDENGEFSVAGECSSDRRRRKRRAVRQSKEPSVRAGTDVSESGGRKCAESEMKGSGCFAGKENVPARDEAMVVSVLPIRDLRP